MATMMYAYKRNIVAILRSTVWTAVLMSSVYILFLEGKFILQRTNDFLSGNSGYRLGFLSGINPNSIAWQFSVLSVLTLYLFLLEKNKSYILIY